MNNNNSKGISWIGGFFILIGLAVAGLAFSGLLSAIVMLGSGADPSEMKDAFRDPANAGKIRFVQSLSVFLSMFAPAVITAFMMSRRPFALLGFRRSFPLKQAVVVFLIVLISLFIASAFGWLNREIPLPDDLRRRFEQLEITYLEQVELMVNFDSFGGYLMSIGILALLPSIFEEVLFRGGLQNFLSRAMGSPWAAIVIVSIMFSLVHFSFFGFLPRLFLGVMLGMIFLATQNLWLCILAHFLNNFMAITQAYFLTRQGHSLREVMQEEMPGNYWGFLGIPVLILLFIILRRDEQRSRVMAQSEPDNYGTI